MIRLFTAAIERLRKPSNPARELAMIGHAKRKADVKAVARKIRRELGMPPARALNPQRPIAWQRSR